MLQFSSLRRWPSSSTVRLTGRRPSRLAVSSGWDCSLSSSSQFVWRAEAHPTKSGPVAADLRGRELSQQLVDELRLKGSALQGADLKNLDLTQQDLSGAQAAGANFAQSDLEGTPLNGADLRGANLRGACLRRASLLGADLSGADVSGADVTDALVADQAPAICRPRGPRRRLHRRPATTDGEATETASRGGLTARTPSAIDCSRYNGPGPPACAQPMTSGVRPQNPANGLPPTCSPPTEPGSPAAASTTPHNPLTPDLTRHSAATPTGHRLQIQGARGAGAPLCLEDHAAGDLGRPGLGGGRGEAPQLALEGLRCLSVAGVPGHRLAPRIARPGLRGVGRQQVASLPTAPTPQPPARRVVRTGSGMAITQSSLTGPTTAWGCWNPFARCATSPSRDQLLHRRADTQ